MTYTLHDACIAFSPPLSHGLLKKRYKRFLADIELPDQTMITVHCPNTGAMLGLTHFDQGNLTRRVGFSIHHNTKRKYPSTLEMIEDHGIMVGVNTHNPNRLIARALNLKVLPTLEHYSCIKPESYLPHAMCLPNSPRTRIDFELSHDDHPTCYIEVKNVHYKQGDTAYFPDSVTTRGQRHVHDLIRLVEKGHRCVMIYVIQRPDVDKFDFADFIDADYAYAARLAMDAGVEVMAVTCQVDLNFIRLNKII